MNGKLSWSVFWALVGIFVVIASVFFIPAFRELVMGFLFIIISGVVFFLLGAALIFLTVKEKVGGMLKKFLILTGASSAGFLVFALLHNAIYGLFGDESFFLIMAVIVCPIGFLVGTTGSITLAIKNLRIAKKSPSSLDT